MKKIILIFILLLVSGCSKKLTCTYEQKYEDISINNKIVFNFKDNMYDQKDVMVFKDNTSAKKYFNDVEDFVDEYNLTLEDNKIISNIGGEIKLDKSKEEVKKQYESYDYKCK